MQKKYFPYEPSYGDHRGFTLLELLVAMLMVSMVTVIIAQALKLSINAWERAQREGDTFQERTLIPFLLRKQLDSVIREKRFVKGQAPKKFKFRGRENGLSFFTSYTPMAGNLSGLFRITYLHDREKKVLFLYQQLILKPADIKENLCPLSDAWNGSLEPSGQIMGVTRFVLHYGGQKSAPGADADSLKTIWKSEKKPYPDSIFLDLQTIGSGEVAGQESWHFHVGT